MRDNRINKSIISIILVMFVMSIVAGPSVIAGNEAFIMDDQCICASLAECLQSKQTSSACAECTSSPDSSRCGCNISQAPDSDEIPAVIPVKPHTSGSDVIIAVIPVKYELTGNTQLTGTVTPEQILYNFRYLSSTGDRAPPLYIPVIFHS